MGPKTMLFNEPISDLDHKTGKEVLDVTVKVTSTGVAMIIVMTNVCQYHRRSGGIHG